jgi:hypothetical protein
LEAASLDRGFAPRRPARGWDGWFAIGIFPAGSRVRWLKLTVFVCDAPFGWHPLAAIEGMRAGELTALVGLADRTMIEQGPLAASALRAESDGLALQAPATEPGGPPRIDWRSRWPALRLDHADGRVATKLVAHAGDPVRWIRAGGLLTYFGVHSALEGEVTLEGERHAVAGFGVVEHAWGSSSPIDPTRALGGIWQWDVLAFHDPPDAAVAALAWTPIGRHLIPLRGVGRTPGGENAPRRGLRVEHLGEHGGLPTRWRGRVDGAGERLTYEARAIGQPARVLQGGAFFGFDWEGELERGGRRKPVAGTGYSEFADPGHHLARRVR